MSLARLGELARKRLALDNLGTGCFAGRGAMRAALAPERENQD
jgi:hypothetical protein